MVLLWVSKSTGFCAEIVIDFVFRVGSRMPWFYGLDRYSLGSREGSKFIYFSVGIGIDLGIVRDSKRHGFGVGIEIILVLVSLHQN